ncbi:PemK family transcriptional regulator, partial [Staphylococcus saprophyticus]|nr:PemK family transcriptional regulator [Staphylococcus saprophyticus]
LKEKLTYLSDKKMKEVNNAIDISLGLHNIRSHKS